MGSSLEGRKNRDAERRRRERFFARQLITVVAGTGWTVEYIRSSLGRSQVTAIFAELETKARRDLYRQSVAMRMSFLASKNNFDEYLDTVDVEDDGLVEDRSVTEGDFASLEESDIPDVELELEPASGWERLE